MLGRCRMAWCFVSRVCTLYTRCTEGDGVKLNATVLETDVLLLISST